MDGMVFFNTKSNKVFLLMLLISIKSKVHLDIHLALAMEKICHQAAGVALNCQGKTVVPSLPSHGSIRLYEKKTPGFRVARGWGTGTSKCLHPRRNKQIYHLVWKVHRISQTKSYPQNKRKTYSDSAKNKMFEPSQKRQRYFPESTNIFSGSLAVSFREWKSRCNKKKDTTNLHLGEPSKKTQPYFPLNPACLRVILIPSGKLT